MAKIQNTDWIRIFIRSFYLQAAWNYESMQALGFAAAIVPVIKKICKTKEERKAFLRRHLEFFNAHPYFASYVLGATIRLEEMNGPNTEEAVRSVKKGLYGPLGSLGDQIFWSGLRPMAGLVGAMIAFQGSIWGPILFLAIYNLPHLFVRYWGLKRGYALGENVTQELIKPLYKRAIEGIQAIGAVATGIFISTHVVILSRLHINRLILFLLCIILCWLAYRRRLSLYVQCLFIVVVGLSVALIFNW
jgi:PTS system mannose-specific IID component